MKLTSLVVGALLTGVVLTAPAHADKASYLQYLRDHGQYVLPFMEDSLLASGQMLCNELRDGVPRGEVVRQYIFGSDADVELAAAQHELCPETVGDEVKEDTGVDVPEEIFHVGIEP